MQATITDKYQITVPQEVRRKLNLKRGDRIAFKPLANGRFAVEKEENVLSDGCARKFIRRGTKATPARIEKAIVRGAVASYRRRNG